MASSSFAELLAAAEEQGLQTWVPESGPYSFTIANANHSLTKAGDLKIGIRNKVVGGPDDGKSFWENLNFSGKATPIAIRRLNALGIDAEFLGGLGGTLQEGADKIVARLTDVSYSADLTVKQNGDWTNYNFKNVELDGAPATESPNSDSAYAAPADSAPADDEEPF